MKSIAILCNYVLRPDRIGGMDRFYKLYDAKLKQKGYKVDWFFSEFIPFEFYNELTIFSDKNKSVEQLFIEKSKENTINYDIIVTHFTQLCTPYYKTFKQLHSKAYIIAVDHNPRPLNGFSLKKKIKKRVEGLLYSKYTNQFIGVSKYTVHHILNDYGSFLKKKTKVVYNGIDTNVFIKRTQSNKNKFIVASHLRKSKGIQDLISALHLIDKELLKNVEIDVYGEGPMQEELVKMAQKYNLKAVVNFKGSSAKLNELFANYSYMLQPTYMECFSLSILESLSANIPVITTTVGGNLEVLTDNENSYIFNPGDVQHLATILTDVISGKKKITTDVSKKVINEFYLEKMVADHIKLLPCT